MLSGGYRAPVPGRARRRASCGWPEHSVREFISRPDLRPPVVRAARLGPVASGLLFLGPFHAREQNGALIVDNGGEPVSFQRAEERTR